MKKDNNSCMVNMGFIWLMLLFTGSIFLSGCATQMVWHQEGKTYAEFEQDKRECNFEATKHGYVQPDYHGDPVASGIAAGIAQGFRRAEIFNACMRAKGWRLVPKNEN